MENLVIDNFIQVDVSVEGQSLRVESSGDKGLPAFFSTGLSNLSSPDAHGLRSYEDVFALRVGDVIKINSVSANYIITDVYIEYYPKGFNSTRLEPFIRVRLMTKPE